MSCATLSHTGFAPQQQQTGHCPLQTTGLGPVLSPTDLLFSILHRLYDVHKEKKRKNLDKLITSLLSAPNPQNIKLSGF